MKSLYLADVLLLIKESTQETKRFLQCNFLPLPNYIIYNYISQNANTSLKEENENLAKLLMRASRVVKSSDRLTAKAKVSTVLGSIPASSDTVEPEGWQMKQC
jgi:hypothetical protein